ncbi:AraC family transcriptional regulator [Dyadobacter bucti]|uniref:AraC family transcriptional regulator n=1 Tax=Dyadobacter bucti TaxID=2572203 RepID=UPI003F72481F
MDYQTFKPHSDLASLIKCYWTLEVPAEANAQKQRILPDGCIEMIFILGDDVKRYTTADQYILQPRAMILGQISKPYFIEPTGYVNSFAVRFYPCGFANFTAIPIKNFTDKETSISALFGEKISNELEQHIVNAENTEQRIEEIEKFLFDKITEESVVDGIVKSTIEAMLSTKGSASIHQILKDHPSKRRQLERNFSKQVGLSPKQLGKAIRLQAVLKMMADKKTESLADVAYESQYFDQAHFTNDFKELAGISPKDFYQDGGLALSSILYSRE